MKAETRIFGTIDIEDEKIIHMEKGMIGFPSLQNFALIFDEEKGAKASVIMWLQSMDDGDIAFPVMIPTFLIPDYSPSVNEEILSPLGELNNDNTYMLVTVKVPQDLTKMTTNLKAPIVINLDNNKAVQLIIEDDYSVRYPIYDLLKGKGKAGE